MKKLLLLFAINFSVITVATAQDPSAPTLQVGLGGLKLTKATPDVEILASIIAKKQDEIKVKLIQNMMLSRIEDCGATVYGYVDNTINIMINEKNDDVRTKNMVENTVNLAFVYVYADFFVRTVDENCCPGFFSLAEGLGMDKAKLVTLSKASGSQHLSLYNLRLCEKDTASDLENASGAKSELRTGRTKAADRFIALLLDMSAEVIRENTQLKELGILQQNISESSEALDQYKNLTGKPKEYGGEVFSTMYNQLAGIIDFTGYFSCINHIAESTSRSLSETNEVAVTTYDPTAIRDHLKGVQESLSEMIRQKELPEVALDSMRKDLNELNAVLGQLDLLNLDQATNSSLSNAAFLIYERALPAIARMKMYSSRMFTIGVDMQNVLRMLFGNIKAKIDAIPCLSNPAYSGMFTKLMGRLYNFDLVETYSDFCNGIGGIADVFPDADARFTVNKIVSFVRNYMIITPGSAWYESQITVDAVDFLGAIQDIPYFQPRRTQILMTMGLNNAYFFNYAVPVPDQPDVRNFSFAAEKIGIKFKLVDWKYRNSFSYGETFQLRGNTYVRTAAEFEPILSDWHLIAYGSGLLYNIVNTGTSRNFEYPLFGIGTGFTFYNDLDFNVSLGIPVLPNSFWSADYMYFGVGFDISLVEYTKAVREKQSNRQDDKKKKAAADAQQAYLRSIH